MAFAAACAQPDRPDDASLYDLALAAARTNLVLAEPVALHPFPLLLRRGQSLQAVSELDFNAFDSTTVAAIVRADPARYQVCTVDAAGSCALKEGEVALLVSNFLEVERDAVGMIVVALDRRSGPLRRQYYSIRIKHSLGRWEVVEFRPIDTQPPVPIRGPSG